MGSLHDIKIENGYSKFSVLNKPSGQYNELCEKKGQICPGRRKHGG
jgi:hypothetical protein